MNKSDALKTLAESLKNIPDPRGKQGQDYPFYSLVSVIVLGLIAGIPYFKRIRQWAKNHWKTIGSPLGFTSNIVPHRTTFSRPLAKITLKDLQDAVFLWLENVIKQQDEPLVAAVDGKTSKQYKDENGDAVLMLNVFIHDVKIAAAQWAVNGDKTNEPTCLKQHIEELLQHYPTLKVLTGDAIYLQRPLLEVLTENQIDYVFQLKENQPELLDTTKQCFAEVKQDESHSKEVDKKRVSYRNGRYGQTQRMPIMLVKN
jgi:hypothetical protein